MNVPSQNLGDLVKAAIPNPEHVKNLHVAEKLHGIRFVWNDTEFLVNKSVHAYEIQGKVLYVTASSALLQSLLRRTFKEQQKKEAEAADED